MNQSRKNASSWRRRTAHAILGTTIALTALTGVDTTPALAAEPSDPGRILFWDGTNWMTASSSGGDIRAVTHESETSSNGLRISNASFSPDGTRIAFADMSGNRIVHTATDGTSKHVVTQNEAYTPSVGENRHPFWSPDGEQIAYFTSRNFRWDLWISPADGAGRGEAFHSVTANGASAAADLHGDWSPRGDRFAYSYGLLLEDGITTILDSSGNVLTSFPGLWPSFSPDGTKIAVTNPTDWTLEVRDADGANPTSTATVALQPEWAPDGQRLVASDLEGDLITLAADGTDPRVILDDANVNIRPDWGRGAAPAVASGPSGPYTGATGIDGEVVRGYRAVFDRLPDRGGFEYWVDRRVGGMALVDVVESFTFSPEFEDRFGPALRSGSTPEWVDWVYLQVLGRSADAGGRAYWIDRLESGDMSRSGLILYFSESIEYRELTGTS